MCELLVCMVDRDVKDSPLHKAGQVITIQADGWKWTKLESANPNWRIISLPGVDPEDPAMLALIRSERAQRLLDNPNDPLADENVNPNLRIIAAKIDTTLLPLSLSASLAEPVKGIITASKTDLQTATVKLAPVANAAVIGVIDVAL